MYINYKYVYQLCPNTANQKKKKKIAGECPRGVMAKSDGLRNCSTRVHTPVMLLRSLSGKYFWERYEPPYPPSYGLNSAATVLQGE